MAQRDLLSGWPDDLTSLPESLLQRYAFGSVLGEGKNGIAYKILSRAAEQPFCLKTIKPGLQAKQRADVVESLDKEVKILQRMSHAAIPRVFEHSIEGEIPYYVCTYHPGQTFLRFKESGKVIDREKAFFVVQLLMDAFKHLHAVGRTHCDFHHNNVLIHEDVYAHGVLIIDFGSGHRDSESSVQTREGGDLRFKPTEAQARYRNSVEREQSRQQHIEMDFRAFGHLLALMSNTFFSEAHRDQRIAYHEFCDRLETGHILDWESAERSFASVINPDYLVSNAGRLFLSRRGTHSAIRIPVSHEVPVGEAILAVVNTRSFQRLRGIKQLSFCEWEFPGGTHSRFEHSLGVMECTLKALRKLSRNAEFRDSHSSLNIEGGILAALVHDIGHYPFAHVMEHYVASRFPGDTDAKQIVSHETHALSLIQGDEELRDAIDGHWGDSIRMEAVKIMEGNVSVVSDLLSGPIDCDKLDYIRRDAHHCGIPIGSGLDIPAVIESYTCSSHGHRLNLTRSGVAAVEGFMIAQDQMLDMVYWHETIRGVMAMFHAVVATLVSTSIQTLGEFVTELKQCSSDYDAISNVIVPRIERLPQKKREELAPLYNLHLSPRYRDIYRPIKKYTKTDVVPNKPKFMSNIYSTILSPSTTSASTVPIDWSQIRRLRECYKMAFLEKSHDSAVNPYDILVDVPWGKANNRMVMVLSPDGRSETPITELSHLKETIFDQPTVYLAPIRVYVSPKLHEKFSEHLTSIIASAEEHFYNPRVADNDIEYDE